MINYFRTIRPLLGYSLSLLLTGSVLFAAESSGSGIRNTSGISNNSNTTNSGSTSNTITEQNRGVTPNQGVFSSPDVNHNINRDNNATTNPNANVNNTSRNSGIRATATPVPQNTNGIQNQSGFSTNPGVTNVGQPVIDRGNGQAAPIAAPTPNATQVDNNARTFRAADGTVINSVNVITGDVTGTVVPLDRTDQGASRIRVRNSQGQVSEYTLDDNTMILRNNRTTKAADIKSGDTITLRRRN